MRAISEFQQIFLYRNPVDFRKSINGLGAIVQEEMKLDPFAPALYIFGCKRHKRIKILYWDNTGMALWYKKLEQDRFMWPKKHADEIIELSAQELTWLLAGIDLSQMKPHQKKSYEKFC